MSALSIMLNIGPDRRDTVLSLVEYYHDGAKIYAMTTHLKTRKMDSDFSLCLDGMKSCPGMERIYYSLGQFVSL